MQFAVTWVFRLQLHGDFLFTSVFAFTRMNFYEECNLLSLGCNLLWLGILDCSCMEPLSLILCLLSLGCKLLSIGCDFTSLRTLDCSCMETFFSIMWLLSLGCNLLSLWTSSYSCMEPLCWMMCLVWDWQRAGQECVWTAPRTCRWNARLEVWEGVTAWLWRHACRRSLAASWLLMAWPSGPVAFDQLQPQKTVLLSELNDQSFEPIPRNVICNTVWLLVSYGSWQAGWAFLPCASYARVFGPEMYNDIVQTSKFLICASLNMLNFCMHCCSMDVNSCWVDEHILDSSSPIEQKQHWIVSSSSMIKKWEVTCAT